MLRDGSGEPVAVEFHRSLKLSNDTVVVPDLVLFRAAAEDCRISPISANGVLLVVDAPEAFASTYRDLKSRLYAAAGVPEYWVVDLAGERVTIFRTATGEGYQERRDYGRGDSFEPPMLRGPVGVDVVIPGRD